MQAVVYSSAFHCSQSLYGEIGVMNVTCHLLHVVILGLCAVVKVAHIVVFVAECIAYFYLLCTLHAHTSVPGLTFLA